MPPSENCWQMAQQCEKGRDRQFIGILQGGAGNLLGMAEENAGFAESLANRPTMLASLYPIASPMC